LKPSPVNRTRCTFADAPLVWFASPTALDRNGCPYDPAGSSRRHRPSSGFLTLSTSCFTRNHGGLVSSRLRSWG
jgi:hypothetical protein